MAIQVAPVVIFKTTSEAFKQKRREGHKCAYLAQIMYQEFIEIALRRGNRTIEATESYIRNTEKGLGFSEREYNDAKKLLREMNLISNSNWNKRTRKNVFTVKFDPMSSEYQEFLIEKNKKIRSDKQGEIRSDNVSRKYKTTSLKQNTTTNKRISSKEEIETSPKSRYVVLKGKRRKLIVVSKKNKSISVSKKIKSASTKIKKNINQGSTNLDNMSSTSSDTRTLYKPKHKEISSVSSLYRQLTGLGFTKHREGTKAHHKTLDFLFELLHPEQFKAPYCKSKFNIPDDYRTKSWTVDEIIETCRFYITKDQKKSHRNIRDFILAERLNTKSWSPMVNTHKMMLRETGQEYDGDEKRLFSELQKLSFTNGIGPNEIKRIIRLIDLYCANLHVNESLSHLYYGRVVFAFGQFISEKIRQASFKSHYMLSERVMQEFVDTYTERGVLVQNGYEY